MNTSAQRIQPATLSMTHPLDEFYARSGFPLPPLQQIDGEEVPEPYKTLLVHQQDMTPTLENFHGRRVHLRVLGRECRGEDYFREVVLQLEESDQPVEFGAIKIHLDSFPPAARERILQAHLPLGRILKEFHISYVSHPKAFLRIASDRLISGALQLTGTHRLYGRCNRLSHPQGRPLAEIVEILPPTHE